MKLKQIVSPNEFFSKLKKHNCKFNKLCGLYPAKCNNIAYIGQLKDFKFIEVFEINEEEAKFFKTAFKTFGRKAKIKIILEEKK